MKTCQLEFDFHGDASNFPLKAYVEWSDLLTCYHIKNIHLSHTAKEKNAIPDIFIRCIAAAGGRTWVHSDSHRPSTLSRAVGKAIEQTVAENEIMISADRSENELIDRV